MKSSGLLLVTVVLASVAIGIGCSTAPKNEGDAAKLANNAKAELANYKVKDPTVQALLDKSVGYAIFPDIGKGGWIIGGSYGRGEVYEKDKHIGYADIKGVSAGFQWGAQNFSELLIFMSQAEMDKFKSGEFSLGANVSAVALASGAAAATDPNKGVIALVDTKGGLMAEAAVGGQQMKFQPLNATTQP